MIYRSLSIVLISFIVSTCWGQNELPKHLKKPFAKVSAEAIKGHIAYLADNRMKGRLPGTPEFELAGQYVEAEFKKLGLEPAGENGSYRQKVVVRTAKTVVEQNSIHYHSPQQHLDLEYGKDFTVQADFNVASNQIEAPLVFAGYGISAPKLNHDDYKGLDVKGKMVIVLSRVPENKFGSTETAHLATTRAKVDMAYQHGAVGVFVMPPPTVGGPQGGSGSARGVVLPNGKAEGRGVNPYPSIKVVSTLTWAGLGKIMGKPELSSRELAALLYNPTAPVVIPGTARVQTGTVYEHLETFNVIGKIPGSDPVLKEEYVVHTAHLDHVGIGRPVNGDSIYNGAHDNASGVASLLEIAKLYQGFKKDRPKRSVLIVMVTGEEMGLLGSTYFANNPTVPKDKIVADINTDMPTILAPLLGIVPLGAEHSTLMATVQQAAGYLGLEVMQDHMPTEVRFVRSDQYSFVLQGIPALHIKYGLKTSDPNFDLDGLIKDFTKNNYHKPSDELNDSFNFEAGRTYVRLNFLISYLVSRAAERPSWKPESIFATK
ncbi:MAG TPA: M28 family peptidase [Haliscomenobacter sp.]|nr:M28 family peptidase [Haliscomenobacter sp.]